MKHQYKSLLKNFAWMAIIIFVILCFINRNVLAPTFPLNKIFEYAGKSISYTIIFMVLYEKCLWKFNPFNKTPVLKKHYEGTFLSSFDNSQRTAKLEIKQTLLSIQIIMITEESKSSSITASIDEILNEKYLTYCYINTPDSQYRNRSEIHYGTAILCVEDVNKLKGSYYTDRKTRGSMDFHPTTST